MANLVCTHCGHVREVDDALCSGALHRNCPKCNHFGAEVRDWTHVATTQPDPRPFITRRGRLTIWAFDVDQTLEISDGPVTLASLWELRQQGDIVGICGNWAAFCQRVQNWHTLISFMNAGTPNKEAHLQQIRMYIPADAHILVGNILGVTGASDDQGAAQRSGWHFIPEKEFAQGRRV